jgi:hypothetical protein
VLVRLIKTLSQFVNTLHLVVFITQNQLLIKKEQKDKQIQNIDDMK